MQYYSKLTLNSRQFLQLNKNDKIWVLTGTGTASSAERSDTVLLLLMEKIGPAPEKDSDDQMLGKSLHLSSVGNSIKSSNWSKKLPQSISSLKSVPAIFLFSPLWFSWETQRKCQEKVRQLGFYWRQCAQLFWAPHGPWGGNLQNKERKFLSKNWEILRIWYIEPKFSKSWVNSTFKQRNLGALLREFPPRKKEFAYFPPI